MLGLWLRLSNRPWKVSAFGAERERQVREEEHHDTLIAKKRTPKLRVKSDRAKKRESRLTASRTKSSLGKTPALIPHHGNINLTSHLRDLLLSCHVETKHPQITTHLCLSIVKTRCTKMVAAILDHSRHGAPLPAPMHRNRNIRQHAVPMPQGYVDITRLLSVLAGTKNSHSKGFWLAKHPAHKHPLQ